MEATFWFEECKGNHLFLVSKIFPKDRLSLFFWKSLIGRIPSSTQSEVLYSIPSPASKHKLAKSLWRKTCRFHQFHTNGWSWRWCCLQWNTSQSEWPLSQKKLHKERDGERSPGKRQSLPLTLNDLNVSIFVVKLFEAVLAESSWQEVFSVFWLFTSANFKCLATKKFGCGLRREFLLCTREDTRRSKSLKPLT